MARAVSTRSKIGWTAAAWAVALIIFFPILYTVITSLKTEPEAIAGFNLIPSFTFENFVEVQTQRDYFRPFMNSVIIAVGSTKIVWPLPEVPWTMPLTQLRASTRTGRT